MTPLGEMILIAGDEAFQGVGDDPFTYLLRGAWVDLGIRLAALTVVREDEEALSAFLRNALDRSRVVALVGRMDQEERDLTRKVLAKVTKRRLVLAELPENGGSPFLIPFGAIPIFDPSGKPPGLLMEAEGRWIMAFPHPLAEAETFLLRTLPLLAERGGFVAGSGVLLRTCGVGLDAIRERLRGTLIPTGVTLGFLSSPLGVDVEVFAKCREERIAAEEALRERLGGDLYGVCGETLEGVVAELLKTSRKRVAVAESCTGGAIGERLTRIPGSTAIFERGVVTYSNRAKVELLGVDERLITREGAVSREVASAMAEGIRDRSGTDLGLAVTGIAGPSGGTAAKPVGLVYVALADAAGVRCWEHRFQGDRAAIRVQTVQQALDHLRRLLQHQPDPKTAA